MKRKLLSIAIIAAGAMMLSSCADIYDGDVYYEGGYRHGGHPPPPRDDGPQGHHPAPHHDSAHHSPAPQKGKDMRTHAPKAGPQAGPAPHTGRDSGPKGGIQGRQDNHHGMPSGQGSNTRHNAPQGKKGSHSPKSSPSYDNRNRNH